MTNPANTDPLKNGLPPSDGIHQDFLRKSAKTNVSETIAGVASTDLDAQLDEICVLSLRKAFAYAYDKGQNFDQVPDHEKAGEIKDELVQALTKLIADREREARIDELSAIGGTGLVQPMSAKSGEVGKWLSLEERLAELRKEGDK